MATTENAQKAETALDAASEILRKPTGGSYENTIAVALIGIGRALLAIADEIRLGR